MSNQQQQSDQRDTRKSKRQRKPNQYYTAGINQPKKNNLKAHNKKYKNQDGDDYSSGEERMNLSSNYRNLDNYQQKYDNSNIWLPCILPNNKYLKVQILFDSSTIQAPRIKEETVKNQKQPSNISSTLNIANAIKSQSGGAFNLLSLFEQAIKHVNDKGQNPSNQKPIVMEPHITLEKCIKKINSVAPPLPPPKRVVQQDKDGKIISVQVNRAQKFIKFNHSKMGQYQVPIDQEVTESPKYEQPMYEQEILKIDQWKAIINANLSVIRSIDIYN